MKRLLRLILKGGLGNQLFQYFAGVELSNLHQRQLVVDTSWFSRNVHSNGLLDPRGYLLSQYEFSKKLHLESEMNWKNSPRTERTMKYLPKMVSHSLGFYDEMAREDHQCLIQREITVFGHWVMKPILPSREHLRLVLIDGIDNPSQNYLLLSAILGKRKVISIHHRLGDYKNFSDSYGVLGELYFTKAIEKLERQLNLKDSEVWLFSDEPELSLKLLSPRIDISKVITKEYNMNEAETIALISKSSGIVCSNSTFSWWAAFLSVEAKTSVVFPKFYMKNVLTRNTGLYLGGWEYL